MNRFNVCYKHVNFSNANVVFKGNNIYMFRKYHYDANAT